MADPSMSDSQKVFSESVAISLEGVLYFFKRYADVARKMAESADNEKRNIIFVSVVEMARKLNISLVVEGVETGENVSLMRECGCNIAQGYYFARPMEESKFAELFREGKLC